jgi:hypothetical protein
MLVTALSTMPPRNRSRITNRPFSDLDTRTVMGRKVRDVATVLLSQYKGDATDPLVVADAIRCAQLRIRADAAGSDPNIALGDYLRAVEMADAATRKFTGAHPS